MPLTPVPLACSDKRAIRLALWWSAIMFLLLMVAEEWQSWVRPAAPEASLHLVPVVLGATYAPLDGELDFLSAMKAESSGVHEAHRG